MKRNHPLNHRNHRNHPRNRDQSRIKRDKLRNQHYQNELLMAVLLTSFFVLLIAGIGQMVSAS